MTMKYDCANVFKTGREIAGYTQEQAAELLDVSVKTIGNWESYNFKSMNADNVVKMAKLYKDNTLPLKWLTMFSPFKEYLPEVEFHGISDAIINVLDAHNDFDDILKLLVKVLKDKHVDQQEQEDWQEIKHISLTLAGSLMALVALCDKC